MKKIALFFIVTVAALQAMDQNNKPHKNYFDNILFIKPGGSCKISVANSEVLTMKRLQCPHGITVGEIKHMLLLRAIEANNSTDVKWLLDDGVNPYYKPSQTSPTAFDIAEKPGLQEIKTLLDTYKEKKD